MTNSHTEKILKDGVNMPNFFDLNIITHGLYVERLKKENTTNSAIASLNIALKSYFSTAEFNKKYFSTTGEVMNRREEEQFISSLRFQEKYIQTIFHFHHFFELLFKDELRAINPVLAVKLETKDAKDIISMMEGRVTTADKNTVEFALALDRLKSLNDTELAIAKVVNEYQKPLKNLNSLRNRSWHRGTFILRYREFDEFIGKNILPCLLECIQHSHYNDTESYWKYKQTTNKIDPIEEIIKSIQKREIDFAEIAFYKAVGSAAFNIPDQYWDIFDEAEAAVKNAEAMLEYGGEDIIDCFVCGRPTLVTYREDGIETDEKGNMVEAWWRIYKIKCESCDFKLYRGIGEPSKYGVDISPIWLGENH